MKLSLQTEVISNFYSTDVNKNKSMLLARGLALCESLCGYSISGKLLKQYTFLLTFTKVFLQFKLTPISLITATRVGDKHCMFGA